MGKDQNKMRTKGIKTLASETLQRLELRDRAEIARIASERPGLTVYERQELRGLAMQAEQAAGVRS